MTEEQLHNRTQGVLRFLEEEINGERPEAAMAILDAARIAIVIAMAEEGDYEPVRRALLGQAGAR